MTSYQADDAHLKSPQDRYIILAIAAIAWFVVPFIINDYWANALLLPFLIYAMAALGLNILVGYCGLISLGTGAFMAVGAHTAYKLMTAFPNLDFAFIILAAGLMTALVGIAFGLPSLRIKGFYLAVATLAAQFFLIWLFNRVGWFYNYSSTGQITAPPRTMFGFFVTGPEASIEARYLICLAVLTLFTWVAMNLTRGAYGRAWMAIRDMDIAAELIGVKPFYAKLSAFAVSSFYIGIAGALYFAVWLGAAEATEAFDIIQSFRILFMIIIGGLGSILGAFLGTAFLVLLPVFLTMVLVDGGGLATVTAKHIEILLIGVLIILFLIIEPHGLARLWSIIREKLRLWPFPY